MVFVRKNGSRRGQIVDHIRGTEIIVGIVFRDINVYKVLKENMSQIEMNYSVKTHTHTHTYFLYIELVLIQWIKKS